MVELIVRPAGQENKELWGEYVIRCRAPKCINTAWWNIRFNYDWHTRQSHYWCNKHLPEKYRPFAGERPMRVPLP